MISPEHLKNIKEIKIRTRRMMNGSLAGGYITKQKGSGFEFDQIRAYSYGDDIRFIDWNSSARTGKLLVRQYLDEKNRTMMLCLDVSASTFFGSTGEFTADVIKQITGILLFAAEHMQDNIGLILFSDRIEKCIPPSRGHKHTMYLIETIFSYQPAAEQKKTDFNGLCRYLIESFTKSAAAIIISDFIGDDFDQSLKQLVCKREVIAVRCLDSVVRQMPSVGYVWAQDPETNATILLNSSVGNVGAVQKKLDERLKKQNQLLQQCRIDCVDIVPHKNFMETLLLFFKQRMAVP